MELDEGGGCVTLSVPYIFKRLILCYMNFVSKSTTKCYELVTRMIHIPQIKKLGHREMRLLVHVPVSVAHDNSHTVRT